MFSRPGENLGGNLQEKEKEWQGYVGTALCLSLFDEASCNTCLWSTWDIGIFESHFQEHIQLLFVPLILATENTHLPQNPCGKKMAAVTC